MGMLNKIGPALKAQSWLQPFLYRVYYIFKILTNGGGRGKNATRPNKILFIIGCGRSGNTLLRRLLMERFDIYIPPETYVLTRQINQYYFSVSLKWPEKVDVILSMLENHPEFSTFGIESFYDFKCVAKKWPEEKQTFVDLIESLYRWLGESNNIKSQWVGDKTPLNTLSLGMINLGFPNAKFIYLERDPVDVVQSYLDTGLYQNAESAAQRWLVSLKSWRSFKRIKKEEDCFELRYEDLVTNPSVLLDEIGNKFAIPQRDAERHFERSALGDVGVYDHHSNVLNVPSATSIGKGRARVTQQDLKIIRKVLGRAAKGRGYPKI